MTEDKRRIDTTLRNNEYYNFQDTLDKLYLDSTNNKIFKNLIEIISSENNIRLAYRNIKNNNGNLTPGVDGKTIEDIKILDVEIFISRIKKKLEFYIPSPIKRVEIPKPNGKTRPLGIPTIEDRLIQQCILQVLEPICEAKFYKGSNGFRPNRSCETAIASCERIINMNKYFFVVDIDIKGFFDNVNHGKLLKQMWAMGIRDKKLLKIISLIIKSEIKDIGVPEKGTPQGGIISPLLSNIVLNELDWWISSQWKNMKTRYKFKNFPMKNGGIKTNKYRSLRNTSTLKECFIVRYADDFKIFCKSHKDAEKLMHATKMWLKDRLKLEISEEKSKIVNLKRHYSEFLGFKFKVRKKGKDSKGKNKYVVISHINDKAINKISDTLKAGIKEMQNGGNEKQEREIIDLYNSKVIGIHNYYNIANQVSIDVNKIAFQIFKYIRYRLKTRVIRTTNGLKKGYIYDVYGKSKQMRYINDLPIVPIGYVQHKIPLELSNNINKYTINGRRLIHDNLNCIDVKILQNLLENKENNKSVEYNDNRLSKYSGQLGKCYITGRQLKMNRISCVHKNPFVKNTDGYNNLILIDSDIHELVKESNIDKIKIYLQKVKLNKKKLAKLNRLRQLHNLFLIN